MLSLDGATLLLPPLPGGNCSSQRAVLGFQPGLTVLLLLRDGSYCHFIIIINVVGYVPLIMDTQNLDIFAFEFLQDCPPLNG